MAPASAVAGGSQAGAKRGRSSAAAVRGGAKRSILAPMRAEPVRRHPSARIARPAVAGLLAIALVATARAADVADPAAAPVAPPLPPAANEYVVTITGNAQAQPRFPGSSDFSAVVYPSLDFRKVGEPERFTAPDDGLSITAYEQSNFRVGPVVRYQSGRYRSDDPDALTGLRKIKWSLEPGVFAEFWPAEVLRARVEIRHGVHGHDGVVGNLGVDYVRPFDRFVLSIGPRFSFADATFQRDFYGVTPGEALLNPRVSAYRPGGGFDSVGALAALTYRFSDQWATTGYASYNRLVGNAAASPIIQNIGTPDQFVFGVKVSYSFVTTSPF